MANFLEIASSLRNTSTSHAMWSQPDDDPGGVRALLTQLRAQQDAQLAVPEQTRPAHRPWALRDADVPGDTEAYDPHHPETHAPVGHRDPLADVALEEKRADESAYVVERVDQRKIPFAEALERVTSMAKDPAFMHELRKVRTTATLS